MEDGCFQIPAQPVPDMEQVANPRKLLYIGGLFMEARMRFQTLSLALLASLFLPFTGCLNKDAKEDTGEADADTDADSDSDVDLVDAGDNRDDAMAVEFDADDGYFIEDGLINPAGDRDFYAFEGTAGQAYLFWAQSYYFYEEVLADTVMRIWDETGAEPLATNDDMPFRMWETDSALFFEPITDGTYYVEILDWSDWLDDDYPAEGGSDMEYSLVGSLAGVTENEPNDTDSDVASWPEETGVYGGVFDGGGTAYTGIMDYQGDTDLYPMTFDSDDGKARWCVFGLYPESYNITPEFTLYDDTMSPVAQTEDCDIKPQSMYFDDGAIAYRFPENGTWYLGVTDMDEGEGTGTYYPGLFSCWSFNDDPDNPGETLEPYETETNDSYMEPNAMRFTETTNADFPGYYYATLMGNLEEQDPGDWLWVRDSDVRPPVDPANPNDPATSASLDGKYLNVEVATAAHGSLLDAEVTVYAYDPVAGTTAELATAVASEDGASHDLQVRDLLLGDDAQLLIEIAGSSYSVDAANTWIAQVTVYTEPSHE